MYKYMKTDDGFNNWCVYFEPSKAFVCLCREEASAQLICEALNRKELEHAPS